MRSENGPLLDRFGRPHTYVRVSVTDRCNYRCVYCMPAEGFAAMAREDLLTFDEIVRIVRVLARGGVERVRLTGGEPTVRRGLEELVAQLAAIEGVNDVSLTTNGHVFAPMAARLAQAGLRRVNISLDSIDSEQFHRLTRGGDLERVLDAIDAARAAGLTPIKINVVVIGGENEEQVEALIERFVPEASNTEVRFIEYMPFHGNPRGWRHVAAQALRERIRLKWEFEEESTRVGGGPATHIRLRESGLRVGFISPITEHFCHACNRLRLQADGHLRTCLSREPQPSLRDLLRSGMSDEALDTVIRDRVWAKVAGHEAHLVEQRAFEGVMTRIGG